MHGFMLHMRLPSRLSAARTAPSSMVRWCFPSSFLLRSPSRPDSNISLPHYACHWADKKRKLREEMSDVFHSSILCDSRSNCFTRPKSAATFRSPAWFERRLTLSSIATE